VELLRERLIDLERDGRLHVTEVVRTGSPSEIVDRAVSAWRTYHGPRAAAVWRDGRLALEDLKVLFYYQNRLSVFGRWLGHASDPATDRREVVS
jgi:hypothetical protein